MARKSKTAARRKPAKARPPARAAAKTQAPPKPRAMAAPKPAARVHPGEILRRKFMEPLDLTANALALALRVPATRIGDLLAGRRAVSADTALRLGRYFGNPARYWLDLQIAYDLATATAERGTLIARDVWPRAA